MKNAGAVWLLAMHWQARSCMPCVRTVQTALQPHVLAFFFSFVLGSREAISLMISHSSTTAWMCSTALYPAQGMAL